MIIYHLPTYLPIYLSTSPPNQMDTTSEIYTGKSLCDTRECGSQIFI